MITLITGGPGTGKTAWLLDQLLELRKKEPNREVYIHGIRNLRFFQHEQIYCQSQLCDICRAVEIKPDAKYVENWPEWKTTGALIVVDEVQRIWRPRSGASKVPESVSGLETHRHYGLDFWIISQGPHLFDSFIRQLVGRHIHLVSKWNGRIQYEWPECKQNVQERSDSVQRPYKLPSRVYKMYDSAEVHTKQDKRAPMALYVVIGASLIAVALFWYTFHRVYTRIQPEQAQIEQSKSIQNSAVNSSGVENKPKFPDFKPLIEGVPESAPAYSHLIKVTTVPLLAGCVRSEKQGCKCFTSQATPYHTTDLYCNEVVDGHRFNPYLQPFHVVKNEETREPTNKQDEGKKATN